MTVELQIYEMDAWQLREIHFAGYDPRQGYVASVVDEGTLIVVGYTGEVERGLALASGRISRLTRHRGGRHGHVWVAIREQDSRRVYSEELRGSGVDNLKSWLRGPGGGA
jgi:hypothetical protein